MSTDKASGYKGDKNQSWNTSLVVNRPFYSCVLSYLAMNASEAGGDHALLRPWQTRTHCCGHIVAHDVSWAAQTGKHLLRTQNVSEQNQKHFCVPDTKFVSATNVTRAGKRGNICVRNNESATMCPRLPGPLQTSLLFSCKCKLVSIRTTWFAQ